MRCNCFILLMLISVECFSLSVAYQFGWKLYTQPNNPPDLTAEYWIKKLKLTGSREAGYVNQFYRSTENTDDLPQRFGNTTRSFGVGIYFLMLNTFYPFQRMKSDLACHYYYGKPFTIYIINDKTGELKLVEIGPRENDHFVYVIPQGSYFGTKLHDLSEGSYALTGSTVCPAFNPADVEFPKRAELIKKFPQHKEIITSLTHE